MRASAERGRLWTGVLGVPAAPVLVYWVYCCGLVLYFGKDLNWDFFNYHVYVADLLVSRRLEQDFMAASMQSYLNGVAYLPLYAMLKLGWPDVAVGLVLASLHAFNLVLLHAVADEVLPPALPHRGAVQVVATLLGASAAIFWVEVGSSFIDVVCSIPVLAAVLCLMRATRPHAYTRQRTSALALTGGWLGVALGLKLTTLPWVAVIGLVALLHPQLSWRAVVRGAATLGLGFAAINGPQAWALWQHFGNPFFPFFNDLFRSPYAEWGPLVHYRFKLEGLLPLLAFPWRLAEMRTGVYSEVYAVDYRVAALTTLLGAGSLLHLWHRLRGCGAARADWQPVHWLAALTGLYGLTWVLLSGNGRYAAPWLLLVGPLLMAVWVRVSKGARWQLYGAGALLLLQTASNALGGVERWGARPWTGVWFAPELPALWAREPHLFLSLQQQSYSALAVSVHPESGFVNLIGQATVRAGSAGWTRVDRLLSRHEGRVRSLYQVDLQDGRNQPLAAEFHRQENLLTLYGLTSDMGACEVFALRPPSDATAADKPVADIVRIDASTHVITCPVTRMTPTEHLAKTAVFSTAGHADRLFSHLERHCPQLPRGRSTATVFDGAAYSRFYVNTDMLVTVRPSRGDVVMQGYQRDREPVPASCLDEAAMAAVRSAFDPAVASRPSDR